MSSPKKYLQDKTVLLLISINAFLAVMIVLVILLRLDFNKTGGYIVGFRPILGFDAYKKGSISDFFSLALFGLIAAVLHTWLSAKIYHMRRYVAVAVLGVGTLLLVLTLIVSYSLLMLG